MTNIIVTYTHNPAAYQTFAKFRTLKSLNTSFEMWLADYKGVFGKKELQALKTLVRHSAKVAGIATIKFKSLVTVAKEKFNFEFTTRTAKRAVEKAKKLGMLVTLETRSAKTNLKGPSVYIWQPYKNRNVTTRNTSDNVEKIAKQCEEIKRKKQIKKDSQSHSAATKMSPHKTSIIKTNIIKLLNTYSYGFKSISYSMTIKKEHTIRLLTQPVKLSHEISPLKPISRLKQIMYTNNIKRKTDIKAIIEMVYGKINSYAKFGCWKKYKNIMFEHAIKVVEVCLEAYKNGKLGYIRSIIGYINCKLNEEITAYIEMQLKKITPKVDLSVSQTIINTYDQELKKQQEHRERQLELYYR